MKSKSIIIAALLAILLSCVNQVFAADEGLAGDWKIVSEGREGRQTVSRMTITKNTDGTYAIALGIGASTEGISDVKVENNTLSFTRTMTRRDTSVKTNYQAELKEGKLVGKITTERGETPFTGTRIVAAPDAVGSWQVTTKRQDRESTSQLTISQNDKGELEGKWTSERGESQISNVKFDGSKLTFDRVMKFNDREIKTSFTGEVKGNELTGTLKSERGDSTVTGKRTGGEIIGKWELTTQSERGERKSILLVEKDMSAVFGGGFADTPVTDLKLDGDKVTFSVTMGFGERTFKTQYNLKLANGTLEGEAVSDRGTTKVTGKKL
jgi:hypothetical protein